VYNGYNFLGDSVYNPFDILLFPEDVASIVRATRSKRNAVQLDNAAMKQTLLRRW